MIVTSNELFACLTAFTNNHTNQYMDISQNMAVLRFLQKAGISRTRRSLLRIARRGKRAFELRRKGLSGMNPRKLPLFRLYKYRYCLGGEAFELFGVSVELLCSSLARLLTFLSYFTSVRWTFPIASDLNIIRFLIGEKVADDVGSLSFEFNSARFESKASSFSLISLRSGFSSSIASFASFDKFI